MLRSVKDVCGFAIRATDSEIGQVDEFLFDDERWTIRYMVVNTGSWLTGRLVLISPMALQAVDWDGRAIEVNLTRQQVEDSPSIMTDQPVSRQMEEEYSRYYGYLPYWYGPGLWGAGMYPASGMGYAPGTLPPFAPPPAVEREPATERPARERGDQHLRSTREVIGYHIQARDDEIGVWQRFLRWLATEHNEHVFT